MNNKSPIIFFLATIITIVTPISANATNVGVKVGSTGLGIELSHVITDTINVRTGFNAYNFIYDSTQSGVEYEVELKLQSYSALLDWHPSSTYFRFSAGIFYNANSVAFKSTGTDGSYPIGNAIYNFTNAEINGNIDLNTYSPYVGIGWSNALKKSSKWHYSFDLGFLYQGQPQVSLNAQGNIGLLDINNVPGFSENLRQEEQNLEDGLGILQYYPVVTFGVSYTL